LGFAPAVVFVEAAVLVETDGAALVAGVMVAPAAGVIVAPAAGVEPGANVVGVVATVGAGVVATDGAGVVVVFFAAAGLDCAFVFGVIAAVALGDALEVASDFFEFLLFRRDCFVASGVALLVDCSAFVFGVVSGVTFFGFFVFLSSFVGGGVIAGA
jgi:hypothetical protein